MLELAQHKDNSFLTLTYSDDFLPALGSLEPKHLQLFLKRFRTTISPLKIRFYAVGEYGDASSRPHYHIAAFGYPPCAYGRSRYNQAGGRENCCHICDVVRDAWGMGQIDVGELTEQSAQYIAGYVTKKLTSAHWEPARFILNGRHPEFSRQSRNPGIGHSALHEIASTLMQFNLEETQADVPSALRHGKRLLPLGQYMRRNLRKLVGKDENTPASEIQKLKEEMLPLQHASEINSTTTKEEVIKKYQGAVDSLIAKNRIKKRRGTI